MLVEKLQADSDSQQATITELHYQLSREAELKTALDTQLQEVRVQVEQLQEERVSLVSERRRMDAENFGLKDRYKGHEELQSALTEQIERLAFGLLTVTKQGALFGLGRHFWLAIYHCWGEVW